MAWRIHYKQSAAAADLMIQQQRQIEGAWALPSGLSSTRFSLGYYAVVLSTTVVLVKGSLFSKSIGCRARPC